MLNKRLFLTQLRIQLRGMPPEEIEVILNDYEGYFDEAKVSGLSEEEASQNLGNPHDIAREVKGTSYQRQRPAYKSAQASPSGNAIVAVALIVFNVVVVLGPLMGVAGLFFGLAVMIAAFVISPLLSLGSLVLGNGHLFELFLAFIFAGIGLFIFPVLVRLFKASYHLLNRYIQWNLRVMRGEY